MMSMSEGKKAAGRGSAGRKRKGEEEGGGQDPGGGKKAKTGGDGREALAVGRGPRWDLRGACERSETKRAGGAAESEAMRLVHERIKRMLHQALSCSAQADVTFSFDDGAALVKGHWGMLCSASQVFGGMFESGMKEVETGKVHVRGVGRESFKGFLEWVYLGRCGEECKAADGRELWLLADMYDVKGVQRWLVEEGVDGSNLPAAYEFGLLDEAGRKQLVETCLARAGGGLGGIEEGGLSGVGSAAVQGLVSRRVGGKKGGRVVLEGFQFVERWWRANGGEGGGLRREDVDGVVAGLDLSRLLGKDLTGTVRRSGIVDGDRMVALLSDKIDNLRGQERGYAEDYTVFGVRGSLGTYGTGPGQYQRCAGVAVRGEGAHQLVAALDSKHCRVSVFNVESGAFVMSFGSKGDGPGQFQVPSDVAFNKSGELFVSDMTHNRISVFDATGAFIRSFGERGHGEGQFFGPNGLAFTPGGDLVVTDCGSARVKVFRGDWTSVRVINCVGANQAQRCRPGRVAVGADGRMYVVDSGNSRVQVFDSEGRCERWIGGPGDGPGQLRKPHGVAVGAGGAVIVSDRERGNIQVFGSDGAYLGEMGASGEDRKRLEYAWHVAVDSEGGNVFVADHFSVHILG